MYQFTLKNMYLKEKLFHHRVTQSFTEFFYCDAAWNLKTL